MTDRPDQLLVQADLHLDIDGVQVQVNGHGQQIDIATDHPAQLVRAARPLVRMLGVHRGRAGLARLGDTGLTITVSGRRGELVRAGAHAGRAGVQLRGEARTRAALVGLASIAALLALGRRRRS